jgi:hypothetical protein
MSTAKLPRAELFVFGRLSARKRRTGFCRR